MPSISMIMISLSLSPFSINPTLHKHKPPLLLPFPFCPSLFSKSPTCPPLFFHTKAFSSSSSLNDPLPSLSLILIDGSDPAMHTGSASREIRVILGPMFVGKTAALLRRIQSESSNSSILIVITNLHCEASGRNDLSSFSRCKGCTATVLLVWADQQDDFFAQCANVGDSACVINIGEKPIAMTEDHRITSQSERNRLRKSGPPLKDGETRLCGLNIARMLGDKFLKEQDARFSSEPYVSQAVHIPKGSQAFALMASDGLWDVIGIKKAVQLVLQTKERYAADKENSNSAERIANFVLSEARTLRTKDNTSIIFLDFDANRTAACNLDS